MSLIARESARTTALAGGEPALALTVAELFQLIEEVKLVVGQDARIHTSLDALHASLRAKELSAQAALTQLTSLVGQATVEEARLVLSNAEQGLPHGWIECTDPASGNAFYYNAHTKESVWERPGAAATSDALDA